MVDANSKEGPEMSMELPLPAHESEKENKEAVGNTVKKRILGPAKRRNNRSSSVTKNAVDYLSHKEDRAIRVRELEIQERQLQLYERKLALDEKRFELESFKRKNLIEMAKERNSQDVSDREHHLKIIKSSMEKLQRD